MTVSTVSTARRTARGAGTLGLGLGLLLLPAAAASAATTELTAMGTGANETKGGDEGATTNGTFTVDSAAGKFCHTVSASGLNGAAVAMHIHEAPAGTDGPVVIPLEEGTVGSGSQTCTDAATDLLAGIEEDPAGYYLNVHTLAFPDGAARGQLSESAPTGAGAGTGGQAGGSGSPVLPVALVGAGLGLAAAGAYRFRAARR